MELAAELGRAQPGSLTMAAISPVFTIGCLSKLLGEDENWSFDLSINMFPEDGCLRVHGVGEDGVPAFTRNGIENLRQIIADERVAGRRPPTATPTEQAPCGDYPMLTPRGVWGLVFAVLREGEQPEPGEVFLDGTSMRAHHKAAGAKGGHSHTPSATRVAAGVGKCNVSHKHSISYPSLLR